VFTTNNRWALKAVAMFGVALIASGLNLAD
jgi:hypothetical protein